MQKMSKEEFIEILSRQQRSGLTIKDFCINEAYTESSFYYWKGKFGLSRRYHMCIFRGIPVHFLAAY